MSYRYCRSALYQPVESVLYLLFGLCVKRCGSFVRQIVASLSHNGIIAVRHTGDEIVAVCRLCGIDYFLKARIGLCIADIVKHRTAEKIRFLQYNSHLRTQ